LKNSPYKPQATVNGQGGKEKMRVSFAEDLQKK